MAEKWAKKSSFTEAMRSIFFFFNLWRSSGMLKKLLLRDGEEVSMIDKNLAKELSSAACEFVGMTLEARRRAKKDFRDNELTVDNSLRLLIDGTLSRTALYMTKKVECADEKISYQIGLSASYVRTHHVVMDLILEGSYVEADILIRKQLESLARMIELDTYPISDLREKTPNVTHLQRWGLGRMYGLLNKTVHFSIPEISELLGWVCATKAHMGAKHPV